MAENNKNNKKIILEICLGILVTVILLAIALIIVSLKENGDSSEVISAVSTSDSMDFKPESSYEISLGVGESCQAEFTDDTYEHLVWVSSNSDIATVDDYGNITGISEGTCNVTVFLMDIDESVGISVTVE